MLIGLPLVIQVIILQRHSIFQSDESTSDSHIRIELFIIYQYFFYMIWSRNNKKRYPWSLDCQGRFRPYLNIIFLNDFTNVWRHPELFHASTTTNFISLLKSIFELKLSRYTFHLIGNIGIHKRFSFFLLLRIYKWRSRRDTRLLR